VVDFEDERNFVRVVPRHGAEHAVRGRHGVAAALDGELDDVLGVEVHGIGGERDARRVLDALVDRQDGDVAGAAEAPVVEDFLHRPEDLGAAVGVFPDAVYEVGAGEVELVFGNGLAFVVEQVLGLVAEVLGNGGAGCLGHGSMGTCGRKERRGIWGIGRQRPRVHTASRGTVRP